MTEDRGFSRRDFLKLSALAPLSVAGAAALAEGAQRSHVGKRAYGTIGAADALTGAMPRGRIDADAFLEAFDYGKVSALPSGQPLREYELVALDREIEVGRGVWFPAWTFNGIVPGPTLRCTEGDRVRLHFTNRASKPHTIHFHGIHPGNMDGVFEIVGPGEVFVYEFDAEPFGLHLYHCHMMPVKMHIQRGMYGTMIIDPKVGRPPAREMVMVMNGFDTDFDGENEFYTANGFAFAYRDRPIKLKVGELVRVYLVNVTELDLINSLHIHANFFHVYRTGTKLEPDEYTDTIMTCQGERHIVEFAYPYPGKFMFHAHQSEFSELGWMGFFDVSEPEA